MRTRLEMQQQCQRLRGELQLLPAEDTEASRLRREIYGIELTLSQLWSVPESRDFVEENTLQMLARLGLIELIQTDCESRFFRCLGYLGAGACGMVMRAQMLPENTGAAIKLLLFPRNHEELTRFSREAEVLHSLSHPSIVKGLCTVQRVDGLGASWYAMELVDNAMTLNSFALQHPLIDVVRVLARATEALAYAHAHGIVHRDLHGGNILIKCNDDVKLLDFGSARLQDTGDTFKPVGSIRGAAPEKMFDPSHVTGKADVFSIGSILYYIGERHWPFDRQTFGDVVEALRECQMPPVSKLPPSLSQIVARTLSRRPEDRPSAIELSAELHQWASAAQINE